MVGSQCSLHPTTTPRLDCAQTPVASLQTQVHERHAEQDDLATGPSGYLVQREQLPEDLGFHECGHSGEM